MSLDLAQNAQPLTQISELEAFFRSAEKPEAEHRLGLEHEKLVYPRGGTAPPPYEGTGGIGSLLGAMEKFGYQAVRESPDGPAIALKREVLTVSLEPGGQFELSGTPFRTAREAHAENLAHLSEAKKAAYGVGLRFVGLGYRPFDLQADVPWMPKSRYGVMRQVLPTRGSLGTRMMQMTTTGQVSLDWSSEEDCVRKTVLTARVTPLLVALYANSPLVEGKPSGFLSFRSHVWTDVDRTRCGFLPAWFDGSFSYRAYVDWALDVPLLFLRREGRYLSPAMTFRQLLEKGYEGKPALYSDWVDHLSTLFPEVRLKKLMEVRGADAASTGMVGALGALMRGLLYDRGALDEAERLLPRLSLTEHQEFQSLARREGLTGRARGTTIGAWAKDLVEIAARGLRRLDPEDEVVLEPLREVAATGRSPAERVLEAFEQNRDPVALLDRFEL